MWLRFGSAPLCCWMRSEVSVFAFAGLIPSCCCRCPACQEMKPVWSRLGLKSQGHGYRVGKVRGHEYL